MTYKPHPDFYSKLVRLKETTDINLGEVLCEFLFQIGAIKSSAEVKKIEKRVISFYSKLVRLKVYLVLQTNLPLSVSIPNWCD